LKWTWFVELAAGSGPVATVKAIEEVGQLERRKT